MRWTRASGDVELQLRLAHALAHADEAERMLAVPADPWDTARRERLASRLAETLGAEAYAAARAEGARISSDDAVAFALAAAD